MIKREWIAYSFLFILILVCMSPSYGWLDSAELTSAASLLGISHPPGQPLYTILGKIALLMPLGSHALRMNLLSGLLLLLSFGIFIKIADLLVKNHSFKLKTEIILVAGLLLFASYSFMIQGVRAELYSLNLFLICSIIYMFLKPGCELAGFFIFGLSLACHPLLTVALIPGIAVFCLLSGKKLSLYIKGIFFILLGMSVYFYLPLRAVNMPLYDFGNPADITKMFWVVTGKLYKAYGELSGFKLKENISNIFYIFIYQLNPLTLLLGLSGLILFFQRKFKIAIFLILIFIFNAFVILRNIHFHVDNPDAHGYLMTSLTMIALGFILFVGAVFEILKKRGSQKYEWPIAGLFFTITLLLLFLQIWIHIGRYNKRLDYSAEIFSKRIVRKIPYGGVVFTGSFLTYSLLSYAVFDEKFRNDMGLIFTGFMANDGYGKNIKKYYPYLNFPNTKSVQITRENLDYLDLSDRKLFVELSIKEDKGIYGIRYPDEVLESLNPFEWFFVYDRVSKEESPYVNFFNDEIVPLYENGGYELRKNILLAIFLHIKHALYKKNTNLAKFLLKSGLKLNDKFDAFLQVKKEINSLSP